MKTVCQIHVVFMPRRFPGRCQENIPSAIQHCGLPRLKLADAECYNLILSDSSYPMSYFCSCLVRVKLQGIGPISTPSLVEERFPLRCHTAADLDENRVPHRG
jgi:hypothetical protein